MKRAEEELAFRKAAPKFYQSDELSSSWHDQFWGTSKPFPYTLMAANLGLSLDNYFYKFHGAVSLDTLRKHSTSSLFQ